MTGLPVAGSVHGLVPWARPMKFLTVSGALSGNKLMVISPRLVLKMAILPWDFFVSVVGVAVGVAVGFCMIGLFVYSI